MGLTFLNGLRRPNIILILLRLLCQIPRLNCILNGKFKDARVSVRSRKNFFNEKMAGQNRNRTDNSRHDMWSALTFSTIRPREPLRTIQDLQKNGRRTTGKPYKNHRRTIESPQEQNRITIEKSQKYYRTPYNNHRRTLKKEIKKKPYKPYKYHRKSHRKPQKNNINIEVKPYKNHV